MCEIIHVLWYFFHKRKKVIQTILPLVLGKTISTKKDMDSFERVKWINLKLQMKKLVSLRNTLKISPILRICLTDDDIYIGW